MRKEEFFEVLGELDDDMVKEAKAPMKRKVNWKVWSAMAACLAVAFIAGAVFFPAPQTGPASYENDIAIVTGSLKIYYVSENGAIEHESVEVRYAPEDIFNEWAALNHILDVTFVKCVYDNGGSERRRGDVVEYTMGDHFTLDLTVSEEFSTYAESERGELLVESLRRTFCDYITVDEFHLIY